MEERHKAKVNIDNENGEADTIERKKEGRETLI